MIITCKYFCFLQKSTIVAVKKKKKKKEKPIMTKRMREESTADKKFQQTSEAGCEWWVVADSAELREWKSNWQQWEEWIKLRTTLVNSGLRSIHYLWRRRRRTDWKLDLAYLSPPPPPITKQCPITAFTAEGQFMSREACTASLSAEGCRGHLSTQPPSPSGACALLAAELPVPDSARISHVQHEHLLGSERYGSSS